MTDNEIMSLLKPYPTSKYGETKGRTSPHKGIDIAMVVTAAGDGKVIAVVGNVPDNYNGSSASGAGNYVWIKHDDGWVTKYMHLDGGAVYVKVGQTVGKGAWLGLMGNTGNSTGAHLHFQTEKNGVPVDPIIAPALSAPKAAPPTTQPQPAGALKVGDAVKIPRIVKTWSDGKEIAAFVYDKTLYVTKLGATTANVSTSKGGATTGNIEKDKLVKV